MSKFSKQFKANQRRKRSRAKITGTKDCPRISVYTSLSGMFVQFIDDNSGKTIISANDSFASAKGTKTERASALGERISKLAKKKGIETAVFDRGSKKYHGRIKALAEALRKGGIKF